MIGSVFIFPVLYHALIHDFGTSQKRKDLSSVTIRLLAYVCCFALIDLSRENLSWQLHHRLIENRFLKSSSSSPLLYKIFFVNVNFSFLVILSFGIFEGNNR